MTGGTFNFWSIPVPNQAKSQSDKFKEMARQLEADDDEAAFDAKLKRLAKASLKEKEGDERDND